MLVRFFFVFALLALLSACTGLQHPFIKPSQQPQASRTSQTSSDTPATPSPAKETTSVPATVTPPVIPTAPDQVRDLEVDEPSEFVYTNNVFERFTQLVDAPYCLDDTSTKAWIEKLNRSPRYLSKRFTETAPIFEWALNDVVDAGLPPEFALIPYVESFYQPHAVGPGGYSGLWQFGVPTGKNHGLYIKGHIDQRFSVLASTNAAVSYLEDLLERFGDWRLAVMGFNAGEYRVEGVIKNLDTVEVSPGERLPKGLSPITYEHLGRLFAFRCLITQPEQFGLELPKEHVHLQAVPIPKRTPSLKQIAKHTPLQTDELVTLNHAQRRSGSIKKDIVPALLVPEEHAEALADFLAKPESWPTINNATLPSKAVVDSKRIHRVRAGDNPWTIARRHKVPLKSLLALNGLNKKSRLRIGQKLRIPATTRGKTAASNQPKGQRTHRIAKGETLGHIAERYGVSVKQLLKWNKLSRRSVLRIGQVIRLSN